MNITIVSAVDDPAAAEAEAQRVIGILGDAQAQALLDQLKSASAAQISNYVDANVTDLTSARLMLKRVILVLAYLATKGE